MVPSTLATDAGPGAGRTTLQPSELTILAALHEFPEAPVTELAARTRLSQTTVVRARARLAAEGFWGPWYDLDLRAVGTGSIVVHAGRTRLGHRDGFDPSRIRGILSDLEVPGIFFHEEGQLFGITMPRTIETASAVKAAFLGERSGSTGEHSMTTFESFEVPQRHGLDEAFVNYANVFDLVLAGRPPSHRRPFAGKRADPAPSKPLALSSAQRATLLALLQNPNLSLEESASAAGVSRRTFARAKASLLATGVIRPSARTNLYLLGFRYLFYAAVNHRPITNADRRERLVRDLVSGSVPVAGVAAPTHTVAVAPFYTEETGRSVRRRIENGLAGVDCLAPPVTMLFSYAGLRRVGYSVEGDLGSAWLATLWDAPSLGQVIGDASLP